jgi:hypothetical protein
LVSTLDHPTLVDGGSWLAGTGNRHLATCPTWRLSGQSFSLSLPVKPGQWMLETCVSTHTHARTQRRQRQKANGPSRFSRSLAFSPDFSWVSVERKGGHTEKVAMSSPGAGRDKRQQHRPPSAPVGETPHGLIGNRVEEGTARLAQSLLERTGGQRIACTPGLCSESSGRTKVAPKQPRSVLQ